MATVAQLIRALQKQDPDAIALWSGNGSCVAHGINPTITRARVRDINGDTFSLIGGDRDMDAVLIDVLDVV